MRKLSLTLLAVTLLFSVKAQNIFPNKLDNCVTERFCLDCGDVKASVKAQAFDSLVVDLNKTTNFGNAYGKILFQLLIDSVGNGCVLSHTDNSKSPITQNIITHFNNFKGWIPAITDGKPVGRVSINVMVEVGNGVLKSYVQRVDTEAFEKSFDTPRNPEVFNKKNKYKNEHLNDYEITVWNTKNSKYPDNMNDYLAVDNNNLLWLPTRTGLMKFDGKVFTRAEHVVDTLKGRSYYSIGVDDHNVKWTIRNNNLYTYDDKQWLTPNIQSLNLNQIYYIRSDKHGELFFCTKTGLSIYKNEKWSVINNKNTDGVPAATIYFAARDSKNRLWIGTFSGSAMIDTDGKLTDFNKGSSILKGKCITSFDEDENGNMYFALYEYNPKDKKQLNRNEGIAVCNPAGEFKQLTTENSGMPANHVTKILYDKTEKALWIATDRAGLVRYDLKEGWENYHNQNSGIPTSYIADMVFDKNGVLYLATRQGLTRLQRKQH